METTNLDEASKKKKIINCYKAQLEQLDNKHTDANFELVNIDLEKAIAEQDPALETIQRKVESLFNLISGYSKKMSEIRQIVNDLQLVEIQEKEVALKQKKQKLEEDKLNAIKREQFNKILVSIWNGKPDRVEFKRDASNPEEFMVNFARWMDDCLSFYNWTDMKVKGDYIMQLLRKCIKDSDRYTSFMDLIKNAQVDPNDMAKLKERFLNFYQGSEWQSHQLRKICGMMLAKEMTTAYASRVIDACNSAGIDVKEAVGYKFLLKIWFFGLPKDMQNKLNTEAKEIIATGSIMQYLELLMREYPNAIKHIEKPHAWCGYCQAEIIANCNSCPTGRQMSSGGRKENHSNDNQSRAIGEVKKPRITVQGNTDSGKIINKNLSKEERENCFKNNLCFWKCGEKFTPGHKCKARAMSISVVEETVEIPLKSFNEEFEPGVVSTCMSPTEQRNARRYKMDLMLNGTLIKNVFLDTGADYSILPFETLKSIFKGENFKKKLSTDNIPRVVDASGAGMKFLGKIILDINYNGKFRHEFLIIDKLPTEMVGIIGTDLMEILGMVFQSKLSNDGVIGSMIDIEEQFNKLGVDLGYNLEEVISRLDDNKVSENYQDLLFTYRLRLEEELKPLIEQNQEITGFCTHEDAEIRIDTIDEIPVSVRQYPLAFKHQDTVKEQIEKWLSTGIIEKCMAKDHYNNPLLVVPKRDLAGNIKSWRTCIDPRMVNKKIIDSTYPLPLIRKIFDKLAGNVIFSLFDLDAGFNRMKILYADRKKTAFTWNGITYQFIGSPFGFKNVPQDFQRIMDRIVQDLQCVLVYIDDIIVSSKTFREHVEHVKRLITRLNQVNLKIQLPKCKLAFDKLIIVGHEVSKEGVTVATGKLVKMDGWETPITTLKQLQSRLGFANYFREFVPEYSNLMGPIEGLRSQGDKIKWLPEHTAIMRKFRLILEQKVLLRYPDFSKQLFVGTDASKYGVGCVLFQMVDGEKRIIRLASRALTESERNYGAPQRELLAVLHALRSFDVYLFGYPFLLYTDAMSLKYLLTREKVSSVIRNWMDEILKYDFKIEHKPGVLQHFEDAISRIYDNDPREKEADFNVDALMAVIQEVELETDITEQTMHDWIGDIRERSQSLNDTALMCSVVTVENVAEITLNKELSKDLDDLEEIQDLELRRTYMYRAHQSGGHLGGVAMVKQIQSATGGTWSTILKDCKQEVAICLPCQRYNVSRHGYHPPKNVNALLPFDHLQLDLKEMPLSNSGNKYYLVLIDIATRFIFLRAIPDKGKFTIAQVLFRIFCEIGFPKILQHDNGTEFLNDILKALKHISKIDERIISPYHHRSNGVVERSNRTTADMIYKAVEGMIRDWDSHLPKVQWAHNTRVVELHGSSPYSLMFARQPNDLIDYREKDLHIESIEDRNIRLEFLNAIVFPTILEKVKQKQITRNEAFNRVNKMLTKEFAPGAYVMIREELRSAKSEPRYEGPFLVVRRQQSGNYLLKGMDDTEYIRPPNVLKLVSPEIVKGLRVEDTFFAAVERIVADRVDDNGEAWFKVRWKGQLECNDSWLRKEDFVDYGPILKYTRVSKAENKAMKKVNFIDDRTEMEPKVLGSVEPRVLGSQSQLGKESQVEKVAMKLSREQSAAVGAYWRNMTHKRKRPNSIIETDD